MYFNVNYPCYLYYPIFIVDGRKVPAIFESVHVLEKVTAEDSGDKRGQVRAIFVIMCNFNVF
jgi:hypothetical protein